MNVPVLLGIVLVSSPLIAKGQIGTAKIGKRVNSNCFVTKFIPSKAVMDDETFFITPTEKADVCIDKEEKVVTSIQFPNIDLRSTKEKNTVVTHVSYGRTEGICKNNIRSGVNVYRASFFTLNVQTVEDSSTMGVGNHIEFLQDKPPYGYVCFGVEKY